MLQYTISLNDDEDEDEEDDDDDEDEKDEGAREERGMRGR